MALHFLNGVKKLVSKKAIITPATKKTAKIKLVVNKAMQTPAGRKDLSNFNAGKRMLQIQKAKSKGLISEKTASKKMLQLAPVLQNEVENKKQNQLLDNYSSNQIIDQYDQSPSPKFMNSEIDKEITEGVDEVNKPEFDVPSPESETNGADVGCNYIKGSNYNRIAMSGAFKKVKQVAKKYKINAQKKVTELDKAMKQAKKQGKPRVFVALKKAKQGIVNTAKKTGLAIPRASFLGMVQLNAFNLANKLTLLAQTKAGKDKLFDVWVNKFGGNWDKLRGAVNTAKSPIWKKNQMKINGLMYVPMKPTIGEPTTMATITAFVTTASPIIASISPLLKKAGIDTKDIDQANQLVKSGLASQIKTEVNIPKDDILVKSEAKNEYCS